MNVSAVPDPATYTSGGALHDPSPLLTVTCAVAALDRAGVTHVTSPDDTHVPRTSSTAFSSANRTRRFVDLTKPRPRIVTVVPPETCPFGGSSRVIRGGRARWFEGAPSPAAPSWPRLPRCPPRQCPAPHSRGANPRMSSARSARSRRRERPMALSDAVVNSECFR